MSISKNVFDSELNTTILPTPFQQQHLIRRQLIRVLKTIFTCSIIHLANNSEQWFSFKKTPKALAQQVIKVVSKNKNIWFCFAKSVVSSAITNKKRGLFYLGHNILPAYSLQFHFGWFFITLYQTCSVFPFHVAFF